MNQRTKAFLKFRLATVASVIFRKKPLYFGNEVYGFLWAIHKHISAFAIQPLLKSKEIKVGEYDLPELFADL